MQIKIKKKLMVKEFLQTLMLHVVTLVEWKVRISFPINNRMNFMLILIYITCITKMFLDKNLEFPFDGES